MVFPLPGWVNKSNKRPFSVLDRLSDARIEHPVPLSEDFRLFNFSGDKWNPIARFSLPVPNKSKRTTSWPSFCFVSMAAFYKRISCFVRADS